MKEESEEMARKLRILREGMMYHVMGRGNERKRIFEDDEDREMFLLVLSEGLERYEGICHAWCLMGNHYHMMVETMLPNLSELMRWVGTTYTVRYNRRHKRNGHLFQGRYRAEVVEEESYTKRLILYIHMNPIRRKRGVKKFEKCYVGGLEELMEYRWSSHRGYRGVEGEKKREGFDLIRRKYWKSGKDYEKEIGWEIRNRSNLNFREEAIAGLVIGGEGFQGTMESHLAHQGAKDEGIRRQMECHRRRKAMEGIWKREEEKKWQIWIRYWKGKESKASLSREYGYANSSCIDSVLKQIQKEVKAEKKGTREKIREIESFIKKHNT